MPGKPKQEVVEAVQLICRLAVAEATSFTGPLAARVQSTIHHIHHGDYKTFREVSASRRFRTLREPDGKLFVIRTR